MTHSHVTARCSCSTFTGATDFWDPAVVYGSARERPVMLFDNAA